MLIEDVLGQFCDCFSVRLRLEAVALALQQLLQLLVVGDDAIVNDGELPVRV